MLSAVLVQLDGQAWLQKVHALLDEALAEWNALHLPGARALLRERLERVLLLTAADGVRSLDAVGRARVNSMRVLAQSARAQDARHGARQLSRSAQRAPTREDCDEGWQNVESIVAGAEEAAGEAVHLSSLASMVDESGVNKAAALAAAAAKEARGIVEQRNHAYTFHADPGFSFGEGWYVAAAGILADIEIQIESGEAQSAQAERFLRDAGLGAQLVAYRSRPRANKALPAIIADAFASDAPRAQRLLRRAFLGDAPVAEVAEWAGVAFQDVSASRGKVLVWVRKAVHDAERNTTQAEHAMICRLVLEQGLVPIVFGDALDAEVPDGALDLSLCWTQPLFQGAEMRRAQLWLFECFVRNHGLVGQVGVTTAGMDGPALMGLPTMYITEEPNSRLGRWVGAVPGYEEVIRSAGYGRRIGETFARWADLRVRAQCAGTPPAGS